MSASNRPKRRFPTFWHLLSSAIIAALAASGLVTLLDATLVLLSTLYIFFLSHFSFPTPPPTGVPSSHPPPFFSTSTVFLHYFRFTAAAGLILPALYVLDGVYLGDNHLAAAAAGRHLFLVACQVLMEGVSAFQRLSLPVVVFVPVLYNTWRLPAIVEWVRREAALAALERGGSHWRVYVGRGLAVVSLLLWSFNLFGFLLPVYLPWAMKRYYSGHDSTTGSSKLE